MKVGGLDLSLTSTGAVAFDLSTGRVTTRLIKPPAKLGHRGERLDWLCEQVVDVIQGCDLVFVEGPSFNSKSSSLYAIAGMLGTIQHTCLWRKRIPYGIVTPAQLKTYATGNGAADKPAMLAEARATAGKEVPIVNDDVADAFHLATMAADWKHMTVDAHRFRHRYVMDEISVPDQTGQPVKLISKKKRHREIQL